MSEVLDEVYNSQKFFAGDTILPFRFGKASVGKAIGRSSPSLICDNTAPIAY